MASTRRVTLPSFDLHRTDHHGHSDPQKVHATTSGGAQFDWGHRRSHQRRSLGSGDSLTACCTGDQHGSDLGQTSIGVDVELIDNPVSAGLHVEVVTVRRD